MRKFVFILLLINAQFSLAQEDTSYQEVVRHFVNCIKQDKRDVIGDNVIYPLYRYYPLTEIADKNDFLKRFDEVFDTSLRKAIARSRIASDWGPVGWHGIMFLNGDVWITEDGKLKAVNYQSPVEKKKRTQLIAADRAAIYETLRNYKEPTCMLETTKYRIRIDEMPNGKYRYASWPIANKVSDKPSLVIQNGTVEFPGTGGNHTFRFLSDGYTYDCDVIFIGENDSPPAALTVKKGDKIILAQPAMLHGR